VSVNAKLPDLGFEASAWECELGGGAGRAGDQTVSLPQCGLDHFSFMVYQVATSGTLGAAVFGVTGVSQVSSTEKVSPSLRITTRSITFCNSRTLPGQS